MKSNSQNRTNFVVCGWSNKPVACKTCWPCFAAVWMQTSANLWQIFIIKYNLDLTLVDFLLILRPSKTAPKKHPKFCGLQLCIACSCMHQQSNLKGIEICLRAQFDNQNAACVACACMCNHAYMRAIARGTGIKNPGFFNVAFCLCIHARSRGKRSKWNKSKHCN